MPEKIKIGNFNPLFSLKLFGLNKYILELINLYKNKKLPKVLLITGDKGLGKFTMAFHLINYVLSSNTKNSYDLANLAINKDNLFYKTALSNVNENIIIVSNGNNKKTSIEDVRIIKKKFNTSSLNNQPRFTIIDDVDLLNKNVANSLLKLIEEPSGLNYFILINNKKKNIIETIKSRSIETKIFVNEQDKKNILNELIQYHNIDENFSHDFFNLTTPGELIKFSEIFKFLNIDVNTSLFDCTKLLLENYKKTKNDIFLDSIDFFLEIKFYKNIFPKNKKSLDLLFKKKDIMKLLYDYKNFNLSSGSVLDFINKHENHA